MKLRDLVDARFERLVIGPPDPAFPLRIAFHQTSVPPVGTHLRHPSAAIRPTLRGWDLRLLDLDRIAVDREL